MAGREHQAIVKDDEPPQGFFLLGDGVDALGIGPSAFLGGESNQVLEARESRVRADVLAL